MPEYDVGDPVIWTPTYDTNNPLRGTVVECTHGGVGAADYLCFLRDEEQEDVNRSRSDREYHVPVREITSDLALRINNQEIAAETRRLLAAITTNEGEPMPEELVTISVPHTASSRNAVFERLNLYSALMQQPDEENWLRHLRDLTEVSRPVNWTIRKGSFMFDAFPEALVNGYPIRIEAIEAGLAAEFVEAASNGKITLAEDPNARARWRLAPKSELEQLAWNSYASGSIAGRVEDDGTTQNIPLNGLKNHMRTYHEYLTSGMRKQFIREVMKNRMIQSTKPAPDRAAPAWTDRDIQKFSEFLENVKSKLVVEDNPFQKLPMLPHKTLSSRTWGIEIEAPHIDNIQTPEYWELKGDGSLRSLDVESMPSRSLDPNFTVPALIAPVEETRIPDPGPEPQRLYDHTRTCDRWTNSYAACSCDYAPSRERYQTWYNAYIAYRDQGRTQQRTRTGEWNSPVLRSFHSRGLKYLTSELEPRRVNNSAGCHVHVGAADLTPDQAVRLSIIYTAFEPLFESEYKRGTVRRFCASVDVGELVNRFKKMRKAKEAGLPATSVEFGSRYWTVNLAALRSHKTVEFRAMGPIYNYEHLVKWAYLVREMVNIARADVPQSAWSKVRTIEDLITLFSKYGKETPTPEWALAEPDEDLVAKIIEGLGTENRRVPHTQALTPGSRVRLVNDDYTETKTYMVGERV